MQIVFRCLLRVLVEQRGPIVRSLLCIVAVAGTHTTRPGVLRTWRPLCQLQLQVLDLSNNMIESVDTQEVPCGLVIFSLVGNSCCLDPGIRQRLTSSLPALKVGSSQFVRFPGVADSSITNNKYDVGDLLTAAQKGFGCKGTETHAVVLQFPVPSRSSCRKSRVYGFVLS